MSEQKVNAPTQEVVSEAGAEQKAETVKTYTQEEVNAMIQSESDKRVTQALKTQQKKFEAEKTEAEKLAQMNESQRREYEFDKKLKEFEAQKREFTLTQNKLEASKVMSERGLPIQFVDYIVAEDADTMLRNITEFEKQFKAAVADAVAMRISNKTPKSSGAKQTGITKEEFRKMNLAQQAEIYQTNPQLYKELTAR